MHEQTGHQHQRSGPPTPARRDPVLRPVASSHSTPGSGTYVCPMHGDVRSDRPGSGALYPVFGLLLSPMIAAAAMSSRCR